MTPQLMVQPSALMSSGIRMSEFGNIYLFKFTSELQSRFEELLEKKKADRLTPEEEAEYVGISELERIFTLINAQLAAKSKWCPTQLEDLYDNEPDTSVNTVTLPNIWVQTVSLLTTSCPSLWEGLTKLITSP